jgi:hypothetical protein
MNEFLLKCSAKKPILFSRQKCLQYWPEISAERWQALIF